MMVMGVEGWRFVFASVAAVSACIGALNLAYAQDPGYGVDGKPRDKGLEPLSTAAVAHQMAAVLTIPTFLIIVLQVRCYKYEGSKSRV